jgi:hypothetical protein
MTLKNIMLEEALCSCEQQYKASTSFRKMIAKLSHIHYDSLELSFSTVGALIIRLFDLDAQQLFNVLDVYLVSIRASPLLHSLPESSN